MVGRRGGIGPTILKVCGDTVTSAAVVIVVVATAAAPHDHLKIGTTFQIFVVGHSGVANDKDDSKGSNHTHPPSPSSASVLVLWLSSTVVLLSLSLLLS